MKLLRKDVTPDGPGTVKIVPEEDNDMWHAYNLIAVRDNVLASTVRSRTQQRRRRTEAISKQQQRCGIGGGESRDDGESRAGARNENEEEELKASVGVGESRWQWAGVGGVGSVKKKTEEETMRGKLSETGPGVRISERVKMKLEVKVEEVDYDKDGSVLRIRGKNILQNEHVKLGQYHTLELEKQRPFTLRKTFWDFMALDVLRQACDPTASADLAVVLMQEGLAHIFLIGRSTTTTRSRIETAIPRKHVPAIAGYEKALAKFFENVLQAFLKHVDFSIVRCAVLASPGFTKDQFRDYLVLEAERRQLTSIIENKSRLVVAHSTSGYKHSLREVLEAPNIMSMIKDTKAAEEDPDRACYGPKHVEVAHERMAIKTLLITDGLLRDSNIGTRKKYVKLIESVKDFGGVAHVFSSMHVSGEQLAQLTGIAAILQFPLPELEDIEM